MLATSSKSDKQFAEWTYEIKESEIRRLLKYAQITPYYFGGGLPGALPVKIHAQILKELGEYYLSEIEAGNKDLVINAYNYGATPGDNELRKILMKRLVERQHLDYLNPEEDFNLIQITQGAQQAIFSTMDAMINPGDIVLVECPSYLGFINVAKRFKAIPVGVPTDEEGIIIDELEKAIKVTEMQFGVKPKLIYVIPTSQNPKGTTMREKRRKQLFDLASEHDIYIFEDDAYKEMQFGKLYKPIKAFDRENERVLYTASTSKEAGVFRLGYTIFPSNIRDNLEKSKGNIDLCTPIIVQKLVTKYYQGPIDIYLKESLAIYKERKDAMIRALDDTFPEGVRTDPTGGFFVWWESADTSFNAGEFNTEIAIPNGVLYVPGKPFFPCFKVNGSSIERMEEPTNGMRLSYSKVDLKTIDEGIPLLGKLLSDHLN